MANNRLYLKSPNVEGGVLLMKCFAEWQAFDPDTLGRRMEEFIERVEAPEVERDWSKPLFFLELEH